MGDNQTSSPVAAIEIPSKLNIRGGVFISLNVKSQKKSGDLLKEVLSKYGVTVFICTDLPGGVDFRNAIVEAVKRSSVFLCLINNAWALSGECLDEYNLAKRLNLTSHESGRTSHPSHRLPSILPVAFPDLRWDQHSHVELLAASTNFICCKSPVFTGKDDPTIMRVLQALTKFHHKEEQIDIRQKTASSTSNVIPHGFDGPKLPPLNDMECAFRSYEPYKTSLRQHYLGTESYYQQLSTSPFIRLHVYESIEMKLTFVEELLDQVSVQAHVDFNILRIEGEVGTSAHATRRMDPKEIEDLLGDEMKVGETYGAELMVGSFSKITGVLSLDNVRVEGTAAPTWKELTICAGGAVLVGVGGTYKKNNPKSGRNFKDEINSTRLVAF